MCIKIIGVIGAGQMGNGIAQLAAMNGFNVIMNDTEVEYIDRGFATITKNLDWNVNKERITVSDKNTILERIKLCIDLEEIEGVDFVIEAITENELSKFQLFQKLDEICMPNVILATNTSSISIGRIAAKTNRQDKVIGMHFMNPVPIMKLVEIIRGIKTAETTFETTWDLTKKFGKLSAESNDYPGFIANRILMPMINEAVFCLYHGVGTKEDIDTVMKFGMNHPMGPLALADLIGLDVCLAIMETLFDGFKDTKYRPCPMLRKYVETGWLGRKTGKGFYEYNVNKT